MTKKEIRQQINIEKSKLSMEEINLKSSIVTKRFLDSTEYKESKVIYLYLAFNQEIRTDVILERAFHDHKKVAVPRIEPIIHEVKSEREKEMNFYYINSKDELATGFYGILEPSCNNIAKDPQVLMVMPGLAFDRDFYRIGYGGGYYDEYLMRNNTNHYIKVALAYDFQILEHVMHKEYDVRVDQIITPTLHLKKSLL